MRETIRLAWPLVLTQVGHVLTGIVDNIFLGRVGAAEQAAGILSNSIYVLVLVFCVGMSYALTPFVTAAHEENDSTAKAVLFRSSLFLNFIVAVLSFLLLYLATPLLQVMKQPLEVVELATPFFAVLIFSMLPVSLFFTCKQYCEGISNTRMAMVISMAANALNIILNYALIWGKFGLPELGYMGSAWASFIARAFMGLSFLWLVLRSPLTADMSRMLGKARVSFAHIRKLFAFGINSAMQFIFEVAAFVVAGLMCGVFGKHQLDAHGIALSLASFTYMFASGIGSASTIRTGIFFAQNNMGELKGAAYASIKLVCAVMGVYALLFLLLNGVLPLAFSSEPEILSLASALLIIAALFQLFDGLQVTLLGILRGMHDVRYSTVISLAGYWVLAIPLAWLLGFYFKFESLGIWIALLVSLAFVAFGLLLRLRNKLRS
jgi:multidrug resistance protein, MATE family